MSMAKLEGLGMESASLLLLAPYSVGISAHSPKTEDDVGVHHIFRRGTDSSLSKSQGRHH